MLLKPEPYRKEQEQVRQLEKQREAEAIQKIAKMPQLRTSRELFVTLVSKINKSKKEAVRMILDVFGSGDVLKDQDGNMLFVERKNIEKILWSNGHIHPQPTIHLSNADYDIYVPANENNFDNEIALYKQFFVPGLQEKVIDPFIRYIKNTFYGPTEMPTGNSTTK